MNFFDIIFWGFYKILDKTIYLHSESKEGYGPRQHAFFISFLFYGINLQTLFSFVCVTYFHRDINYALLILLVVTIFIMGYVIYFKRKRVERVITKTVSTNTGILYVCITLIYLIVSCYLMFIEGNYARYKLTGLTS